MFQKYIKIFIIIYFLMFCLLMYIFTEHVFSSSIDQAYRLGYSFLISLPLTAINILFISLIPTIFAKFLIYFLFIPYDKIKNKYTFYNLSSHEIKYIINHKKYSKIISNLKLLSTDKIIGNIIFKTLSHQSNDLKMFSQELCKEKNFINKYNSQEHFSMYINFTASEDDLIKIVNNVEIKNILEQVNTRYLDNLLKKEDNFINLYVKYKEHPMIIKEVTDFLKSGICKNDSLSFPSHKIIYLERFETSLINSKYFFLEHSNYIKKIQEKRNFEINNVYRMHIRNNDLVKKLLYLKDKEITNLEKNYLFEDTFPI